MSLGYLPFVLSFLLSLNCSVEGLVLPPVGRTTVKLASPVSTSSSHGSSTALFFKNTTRTNFDIENSPNLLTPVGTYDDEEEDFAAFDDNCFPGLDENDRFECDPSVAFWRDFQNVPKGENIPSAQDNLRDMTAVARRFAGAIPSSSYFGRHLGRTAYFVMNAAVGDAAFEFSKRIANSSNNNNNQVENNEVPTSGVPRTGPLPMGMSSEVASRLVLEALLCYEQDYFDGIAKNIYREPWDMATPNHRQSNPFFAVTQTSRFVREAVGTLNRRSRGDVRDKEVRFFQNNKGAPTAKSKVPGVQIYPDYYQTAFHYQGDGWMSTDSANVYETSTETLFLGRQDSMQRTSLPPLTNLAKTKFNGTKGRPMRVLEVACGTGRFMTFVRDNLPLDAEYTAVDLSPFYLEKASENDAYWRRMRAASERKVMGDIAPATLVQAKAESLPFDDDSFDAVVCVYLFHELPRHVRAKAAAEMARVVSPGGTVVFTDSIQKGDRPGLDQQLPNFHKMNEPFWVDYVNDDLVSHFTANGLDPKTKIVRSTSKSLSFSKPGELNL